MFKATDYIKKEDDYIKNLYNIINFWEENRCAGGYEDIYDLSEKGDFIFLVNAYDIETAISMHSITRFCLGGANFKNPIPLSIGQMEDFVNREFDVEYFIENRDIISQMLCGTEFDTIPLWNAVFKNTPKDRVEELMEQFMQEFPNGDSMELARFIYAHAKEDLQ